MNKLNDMTNEAGRDASLLYSYVVTKLSWARSKTNGCRFRLISRGLFFLDMIVFTERKGPCFMMNVMDLLVPPNIDHKGSIFKVPKPPAVTLRHVDWTMRGWLETLIYTDMCNGQHGYELWTSSLSNMCSFLFLSSVVRKGFRSSPPIWQNVGWIILITISSSQLVCKQGDILMTCI